MISDIGEGSSALYCLTDREQCCSTETGAIRGLWRLPDGNPVTTANMYTVQGFSSIHLSRRSSAVGPTGVYTCEIPDADNILWTLSITISEFCGGIK